MEVKRTAKGHQGVEGKGTALHHLAGEQHRLAGLYHRNVYTEGFLSFHL